MQIYLEGKSPVRHPRAPITNCMGIDPGPQNIAYFAEKKVEQDAGADGQESAKVEYEAAIVAVAPNVLQRKMERSRRAMNPDNYNNDGTVKKGAHQWKKSNRYLKTQAKYQELGRKQAATRKRDHGTLINQLLAKGGTVKVEKNNYRAFQRSHFSRSIQRSGTF